MHMIRLFAGAALACALSATPTLALSLKQGAQPAEYPPASYSADTYVDSRGCVYIRAGFDGAVTWVPRVSRDRQVVCGQNPTLGGAPRVAVAATPAPAPAPAKVAPAPRPPAAQTAAAKPAATPARRVTTATAAVAAAPAPQNYRPAWDDDRLNPLRGERTAAGRAQMNRIWTQTVPRELIASPSTVRPSQGAGVVVVSSKSTPTAAASHRYVQVGSFGVAANARNTSAVLQRLGLPVAVSKQTSNGKALQVVLAGPFGAQADLQAALAKVRAAGYGDAFLRR